MTDDLQKRIMENLAQRMAIDFDIKMTTVSTGFAIPKKESLMPGKYNTFNIDDLPEELRDLAKKQEEEMEKKLAIPKELYEKQHQQDQLDSFRRALEIEREKQERNDPVKRELVNLRNEVEHLKEGMRKIGVLLDTDLPDDEAFDQFKALRTAYGKYKMVEKLTLGEDE